MNAKVIPDSSGKVPARPLNHIVQEIRRDQNQKSQKNTEFLIAYA